MRKRIISMWLCLSIVIMLLQIGTISVSAETNGYTQEEAVKYIKSMIGNKYDVPPSNSSYDCVDLANEYYHVVGCQAYKARGNGGDFCTNSLPSGWKRYYISDGYSPQEGDVVSWAAVGGWGPYGHVALVLSVSASNKTITVVEQSTSRQIPATKATYKWGSPTCYIHPDFNNIPSKPTLTFSDQDVDQITITWGNVSGAKKYDLEYHIAGDDYTKILSDTTKTSYTHTGLTAGKRYWYRVTAKNDSGATATEKACYTKNTKPTLSKVVGNVNGMTIKWNKPTDAISYVVRRRAYNADYEDVCTINNGDTTTWTDYSLSPGCQYYYYIHATCEHSDKTYTCNSTANSNYTLMNAVNVSAGGPYSMNLSWSAPSGNKSINYVVQRSLDNNTYNDIATLNSSTRSYTDTGLTPDTRYYYRIVVMSDSYCTQTLPNSAITATPAADTEAPTISNAYISDIDENGFTINCYIQDNDNTSGVWVNTCMPNNEWKNIWIPAGNGNFSYRINATDYAGQGAYDVSIWVYDNNENSTPYGYGKVNVVSFADLGDDFTAYITSALSVMNVTQEDDANVTVRSFNGTNNQIWNFIKLDDNSYFIRSIENFKQLDVYGYSTESGANVAAYYDNGDYSTNQRWYVIESNGKYKLKPACSECMLDVAGGNTEEGTNIQVWEDNGTVSQEFYINKINSTEVLTGDVAEYDGHFYQSYYVPGLTWHGANTYAQSLGGHLVTISDEGENEFVQNELFSDGKEFFIGLNDVWDEGNFTWANGESVTYTNWSDDELNNCYDNEDAVYIRPNGEWNDANANTAYDTIGFIVEYEPQIEAEFEYNGHQYRVYSLAPSWDSAKELCEHLGGHLVTISDENENATVAGHLGVKSYYIGASRDETGAIWNWVNGEPFEYTNWYVGEPSNINGNETVCEIYQIGQWNDCFKNVYQNEIKGFICEFETDNVVLGDVNVDGEIDVADAVLIMKHDAGLTVIDNAFQQAADVNNDGEIDIADAILIMKYDAGLISNFN